jgi:hypothetical protein
MLSLVFVEEQIKANILKAIKQHISGGHMMWSTKAAPPHAKQIVQLFFFKLRSIGLCVSHLGGTCSKFVFEEHAFFLNNKGRCPTPKGVDRRNI